MTNHEPEERYLTHLEWQVETALRRRERFARPTRGPALALVRSAALAVVCLLCGAGIVVGAERLQQSRDKEFLLARTEILTDTARARLAAAQDAHERTRLLHEAGLTGADELLVGAQALRMLELDLEELELAREEIALSGREPDARLSAPLVRGRDFVQANLRLALERASAGLAGERELLSRTRLLVEQGMVSSRELAGEEARLRGREAEVARVEQLLGLRADFRAGRVDERRLLLLELRVAAAARGEQARHALQGVREQLEYARQLEAAGRASNESPQLELELRQLEGALQIAELELARIDEELAD